MKDFERDSEDVSWMELGNCHGKPEATAELFDPSDIGQIEAKNKWCSNCPVKQQCLDYAMKYGELNGVWGNTTEDERKELRRKLRAKKQRNGSSKRNSNSK